MSTEVKDITQLEFSFECWMPVDVNDLDNAELWRSGRVKRFWLKYCTLHMELDDGTIVEEHLPYETIEDNKWPIKTMVEVTGNWEEWKK